VLLEEAEVALGYAALLAPVKNSMARNRPGSSESVNHRRRLAVPIIMARRQHQLGRSVKCFALTTAAVCPAKSAGPPGT
jgi:hypothetical protein